MSTETDAPSPPTPNRFVQADPADLAISDCNERSDQTTPSQKFVDDVRINGVEEPPIARPHDGDAEWEVVAGQVRRNAAIEAGLDEITIEIKELTDLEAIVASTRENVRGTLSSTVSANERSRQVQRAVEEMDFKNPSPAALSEQFGVAEGTVRQWSEPLKEFWEDTPVDPTYQKSELDRTGYGSVRTEKIDGVWVVRGVEQLDPIDIDDIGGQTLIRIRNIDTEDVASQVELAYLVAGGQLSREHVTEIKKRVDTADHFTLQEQLDVHIPFEHPEDDTDQQSDIDPDEFKKGESSVEEDGWEVTTDTGTEASDGFASEWPPSRTDDTEQSDQDSRPEGSDDGVALEWELESDQVGPDSIDGTESKTQSQSEVRREDGADDQPSSTEQAEQNDDANQQVKSTDVGFMIAPDETIGLERIKEIHDGLETVIHRLETEDDPGRLRTKRLMFNHVAHQDIERIKPLLMCPVNSEPYTHLVAGGVTVSIDEAVELAETAYQNHSDGVEELANTDYEQKHQHKRGWETEQKLANQDPSND